MLDTILAINCPLWITVIFLLSIKVIDEIIFFTAISASNHFLPVSSPCIDSKIRIDRRINLSAWTIVIGLFCNASNKTETSNNTKTLEQVMYTNKLYRYTFRLSKESASTTFLPHYTPDYKHNWCKNKSTARIP